MHLCLSKWRCCIATPFHRDGKLANRGVRVSRATTMYVSISVFLEYAVAAAAAARSIRAQTSSKTTHLDGFFYDPHIFFHSRTTELQPDAESLLPAPLQTEARGKKRTLKPTRTLVWHSSPSPPQHTLFATSMTIDIRSVQPVAMV